MIRFIGVRILRMVVTVFVISIILYTIIELPPGDYLTNYIANLRQQGEEISREQIESLRQVYGLDKPVIVRYFRWITNFMRGNLGYSFLYSRPVAEVIGSRMMLTLIVTLITTFFIWIVSFAIGLYSAMHQYSVGDYAATFLGFIGISIPNFLLALVIMWIGFRYFGASVGGLFSPEYLRAAWSWAKVWDMLKHVWVPVVVLGTAGTARLIRVFRATLLDQIKRPYVETARSKGMKYRSAVMKHPVRIALIPFISTVGWTLPTLLSGATVTAVVLNLPMNGPVLLRSLLTQDMALAATFVLLESIAVVIGTFLSDVLLAALDPRIRVS
jgi:peptide/nickel transport system permease protein